LASGYIWLMNINKYIKGNSYFPILTPKESILGLYESVYKLSVPTIVNRNRSEVEKGLANVLVGIIDVAKTFKINDLENILEKRLEELKKEAN